MRSAADAAPSFVLLAERPSLGGRLVLDGEEGRYLARVVRVRDGERVTATDGAGALATLRVERSRPEVEVVVEAVVEVAPPAACRLWCGAPEGDRGDWTIEKAAELGVTEFVPLDTARTQWGDPGRSARWERLAVAALRQSRSAWLMRVAPVTPLAAALAAVGEGARWLADPAGRPAHAVALGEAVGVTGAVGPSTGFSDDERKSLLACGFESVALAPARLRAETAALALAAHWAARRVSHGGGGLDGPPTRA